MNNIIKFRDQSDISKGFYLDLEGAPFEQVFLVFSEPQKFISDFTDAFLMMGFSVQLAEEAGSELYEKTRKALALFIDEKMSHPVTYTHASTLPLQ